jgi:hypothetical protein
MNSQIRFQILDHNQIPIHLYPCDEYLLAPYPISKEPIFNDDNLTTANRPYYMEDVQFREALKSSELRWGVPGCVRDISWRLHILLNFLSFAISRSPNGCFIELGTGKGYMAAGIASYFKDKILRAYLYDTFNAFLPGEKDHFQENKSCFSYAKGGEEFARILENQLNNVSDLHTWRTIPGLLPESITQYPPVGPASFIHVDLNDCDAELSSLNKINYLIDSKTVILFDDTGSPGSEMQQKAHSAYSSSIGRKLLYLPTGQAALL